MRIEGKRIAVLMGGVSNEREISLVSGRAVVRALRGVEKASVVGIDITDEKGDKLSETLKRERIDVVFIALHGRYGEDGGVQGLLEKLGIPYTGSGIVASATCFNKYAAKQLLTASKVPTPQCLVLDKKGEDVKNKLDSLGFPLVLKPCSGGSAIGVSMVRDENGLEEAFHSAGKHDDTILAEKYIPGREITVSILGNRKPQVLPVIEIIPKMEFYDYRAKYEPGMSEHILPAKLREDIKKHVEEKALLAYSVLGCRGFGRIDIILSRDEIPYIIDVNTIPGLTPMSLFPEAARAAGLSLGKLSKFLIEMIDE